MRYEGPESDNPFAFRCYDPARVVMGKTMAERLDLRSATGTTSPRWARTCSGAPTFGARPWQGDDMKAARLKADVAFKMFSTLGFPFFTFHDEDGSGGREPRRIRAKPRQ